MKTIQKHKCCACGYIHDDIWDAEDCCKPDIQEVTMYLCEECEEEYETEKEAFECCNQTKLPIKSN